MTTEPAEPAAAAPATPRYPCPRCGEDRGADTRILCAACWREAPQAARTGWLAALRVLQTEHPAALRLLTWARPDAPAAAPTRSAARNVVLCSQCRRPTRKPTRRALAADLREVLPEGTPKKVRERAELVARRLEGMCESCAAPKDPLLKETR